MVVTAGALLQVLYCGYHLDYAQNLVTLTWSNGKNYSSRLETIKDLTHPRLGFNPSKVEVRVRFTE